MNEPVDIPPYSVRESKRARRVTLKISRGGVLEVVIPVGFSREQIPRILCRKKEWIQKVLRRFERKESSTELPSLLPEAIYLKALDRHFTVQYINLDMDGFELRRLDDSRLELSGNISNVHACQNLLRQWLLHQGRLHLIPWIERVGARCGFTYQRVQVRRQKSRWGSCSAKGTISLNCKLLFLSPELVNYIMVHELSHTVHLNHSASFWFLVARVEPRYKDLDAQVNAAAKDVPGWVH